METGDILGLIGMLCGISAGGLLGIGIILILVTGVGGGGTIFMAATSDLGLMVEVIGGTASIGMVLMITALFVSIGGLVLSIIGVSKKEVEASKMGIVGIIINAGVLGVSSIFLLMFSFVG